MRAAVITPDSTTVHVVEAPDGVDLLAWLHEQVGTDEIDFSTLRRFTPDPDTFPRINMVLDDMGLLRDPWPPINRVASRLYNPDPAVLIAHGMDPHPIVGTVVLTAYDEEGATVDLPMTALETIRGLGITVVQEP